MVTCWVAPLLGRVSGDMLGGATVGEIMSGDMLGGATVGESEW